MRILLIGSADGRSMKQFTDFIRNAIDIDGVQLITNFTTPVFSKLFPNSDKRKYLLYFDKFLLRIPRLFFLHWRSDLTILVDHSDALYVPILLGGKKIVFVHDIIAIKAARGHYFDFIKVGLLGRFYQRLVSIGLGKASVLVSVSQSTSKDLVNILGLESIVIYNMVEKKVLPVRLSTNYYLIVSSSSWRKQRQLAINLWARIIACDPSLDLPLIIVGPNLTDFELAGIAPSLRFDRVTFMENLSQKNLEDLYASSFCLITASCAEGFNWPIAEANSFGKPVICTNMETHIEVAALGGVFFNDISEAKIVSEILMSDYEKLARLALLNSMRFTPTQFSIEVCALIINTLR